MALSRNVKYFLIVVFGIFHKDATFQRQIFNLGLKTKVISKGNFFLDKIYHKVIFRGLNIPDLEIPETHFLIFWRNP